MYKKPNLKSTKVSGRRTTKKRMDRYVENEREAQRKPRVKRNGIEVV